MAGTEIEITMLLDLGDHAPGDLLGLARALALTLKEDAEEAAADAAEASGSEEVHAVRPEVRYRVVGVSEWHTTEDEGTFGYDYGAGSTGDDSDEAAEDGEPR